jgi:two-component system, OmpR family, sensor histidine kinase KdpD
MDNEERPNPEELLKAIKREEERSIKGRLKIFLGMAAGVGKTYAMLQDAQKLRALGTPVFIGYINTHGRIETAQLMTGLPIIPELQVEYKGIKYTELNLEEILKIHPEVVLVDELAHTNIYGSKHPKRWQDVLEILENGIDVYTTLNVQHIESLKDVIEDITGIEVRETVPDSIIENADSIVLVDITVEELFERLKDGKVYLGEQPAVALKNFFQESPLTALREIVFRYAAEKVDHDLHAMTSTIGNVKGVRARERLLVVIRPDSLGQKLIRTTSRLAYSMDAPWYALYVNDGSILSDEEQALLSKNILLAKDLGAELITVNDPEIATAVQRVARQKGVTQIISERPTKRSFFNLFKKRSLCDKLSQDCSDIDIHLTREDVAEEQVKGKRKLSFSYSQIVPYVYVTLFVLLLSVVNWLLLPWISYQIVGFLFLLGILTLSLFYKKGPIFFASCLYALIWDYFFIPPVGTFVITSKEDTMLLALYFSTAVITGILIDRAKTRKELLQRRDLETQALYEIVDEIAHGSPLEQVLQSLKYNVGLLLNGKCEVIFKPEVANSLIGDDKEKETLAWVFENAKEAGASTTTFAFAKNFYLPLKVHNKVVAVIAFQPMLPLTVEQKSFLYTIGQQLAYYLDKLGM